MNIHTTEPGRIDPTAWPEAHDADLAPAAPVATLPAYYFERSPLDRLAAGAACESFAPVVDPVSGAVRDALPWSREAGVRWA